MPQADLYRELIESIPVLVYLDAADDSASTTYISPQVENLLGYPLTAWYDDPEFFLSILHPDDRERLSREIALNNSGSDNRSEYRLITADGKIRWFYDESTVVRDASGSVVGTRGCMIDVTERVLAEQRSASAHRKYRELVDDLPVTMYIDSATPNASTLFVSPQIEALCGYSSADFVENATLWRDLVEPDDHAVVGESIAANLRGEATDVEYRIRHRDGRVVWVQDSSTPIVADDGTVRDVRGYLADITQRKATEAALRHREEELRQARSLEALGRVTGGVAHDFNNLLTVILGYAEEFVEDHTLPPDVRRCMSDVADAGRRAAELTRQLLAFSRKQMLSPKAIDMRDVVADMEGIIRRVVPEHTAVSIRSERVSHVVADRCQIEQVLMNLVLNARDAQPVGGRIEISVRTGIRNGQLGVETEVADWGPGIAQDIAGQIFDPFFTTKEQGTGTGLGLSTVHGIVQQSGGTVEVSSRDGGGARFVVWLPTAGDDTTSESSARPTDTETPPWPVLDSTVTVLVVEDQDRVRDLVVRSLSRHGVRVLEATSAAVAIDLFTSSTKPVDLLVTDVVMPGMGGRLLAERIRDLSPATRVLYMTGYTDDEVLRHGIEISDVAMIAKPFTPNELIRRVGEVLAAPACQSPRCSIAPECSTSVESRS